MNFRTEKYSEEEIREYISHNSLTKEQWDDISWCQKLSEDFIREFSGSVDWWNISYWQDLSEDFIREFSELVDWYNISLNQALSRRAKYSFHDKVLIKIRTSNNPKEVL